MCMYTHTHTRTHTHQAAASTPGHEDANLMTAAISFFVLLGTIGYWMFLRSKAVAKEKANNGKLLLSAAYFGNTYTVESLFKAGADVGCKDGVRVCACVVVSILCMRMCACVRACVCRYTYTEAFWHMCIQNQMYRTWMIYAYRNVCDSHMII